MNYKKAALFITPISLVLSFTLFWTQFAEPRLAQYLLTLLPKVNSAQDIVSVKIEKINLSILKLSATANQVLIEFKNPALKLAPVQINAVTAQMDIFDLIIGQLNLSKLTINNASWKYSIVSNDKNEKIQISAQNIFDITKNIPIDRIIINDSKINLTHANYNLDLLISDLDVSKNKHQIKLNSNKFDIDYLQANKEPLHLTSEIDLHITPSVFNINTLKLQALDSYINLKAQITDLENLVKTPSGSFKIKSKINLEDLRTILLTLSPQKKRLPSIIGFVETTSDLKFKHLSALTGNVNISTTRVAFDHFKLGQAEINAKIEKNEILVSEIKLEHPAGKAQFKNLKISQTEPYSFSTSANIDHFDLQKMFLSLGLNEIPAGFIANGSATCGGDAYPNTHLSCKVLSNLKDIWVKTDLKEKFHILKIKSAQVNGDLQATKTGLSYQAQLQVGGSKGTSDGTLDFNEGFKFNFATEKLSFTDVESLADLNIRGDLNIIGQTTGDTSHGVIKATAKMDNTEIDGFKLGQLHSTLNYAAGQLTLNELTGKIGKSVLDGHVHFDFFNSAMDSKIKSEKLMAEDLMFILAKKFELDFNFTGSGKAEVDISGPLDFWKLSYSLNSEFKNGLIFDESYSQFDFNLKSNGKIINFNNVNIKKTKSNIALEGFINTQPSDPLFNIKIKANPFLLEEINHIVNYAPTLAGIGYAEGQISGPISAPEIFTNYTLKQVSYDKIDYPNSQGKLTIDKNDLNLNGQFFGRQIQSDVIWPWNKNDSFSAKILVRDLNPLFLLPLISLPQPNTDFYSKLNGEIDLVSKNRDIATAEGFIKITDFILQRGTQFLKLEQPASFVFKSGLSQMEPVNLKGENSFLKIKMLQNITGQTRLNLDADLQLRLFHFLVPFAQTLTGNLVANSQIQFKNDNFELLGDGELIDGVVGIKGFPQTVDNINTPIEFSKSKIFLSDITAQLGQSDVTGIGHIDIIGSKNILVQLKAVADNVEINFPDKIHTAGKANILFSGNWLPYNLKIDYKVNSGLVEKDFEADTSTGLSLKASSFLPPKQIEQLSPSLNLDVNIDLTKGIILKNKLIEGEATGLLNVYGTPEAPLIKGKIDIKQGSKIIFKDKYFDVQTASILFQQTKEINPDLYISANSRVSDYDINLLVQGPSKNPIIKPTSQPPLSENDLFSLLALGFTSQTDQNLSSETQQKQTGLEVLATLSNQSQLNKRIQEKLGLTVQLAPSIDSTKNIAVPKVVVSKKISNKLNVSYSKPFTGNDQNQEVKLQYFYNNNMSLLFNYQNKDTSTQSEQITNTNNNSKGILGLDLEYRDEFK